MSEKGSLEMTDEDMARALQEDILDQDDTYPFIIAAFAAIREECARVADGRQISSEHFVWNECCKAIAAAIRGK